MNLTKTSCLDLVKQYVEGIEKVKPYQLSEYRYYSEKKNKHFHFKIYDLFDDFCLHVMVCNYWCGDVRIWITLSHLDSDFNSVTDDSICFHIGVDGELKYSTNCRNSISVIGML